MVHDQRKLIELQNDIKNARPRLRAQAGLFDAVGPSESEQQAAERAGDEAVAGAERAATSLRDEADALGNQTSPEEGQVDAAIERADEAIEEVTGQADQADKKQAPKGFRGSALSGILDGKLWHYTRAELSELSRQHVRAVKKDVAAIRKATNTNLTGKAANLRLRGRIASAEEWGRAYLDNHEWQIREALEEGKDVRPEVLADYPKLQKEFEGKRRADPSARSDQRARRDEAPEPGRDESVNDSRVRENLREVRYEVGEQRSLFDAEGGPDRAPEETPGRAPRRRASDLLDPAGNPVDASDTQALDRAALQFLSQTPTPPPTAAGAVNLLREALRVVAHQHGLVDLEFETRSREPGPRQHGLDRRDKNGLHSTIGP